MDKVEQIITCPTCGHNNPGDARFCLNDGTPLRDGNADDPLIGRLVGNYRLLKRHGEGGFGVVYLAEHRELGTRFAVKILHPQFSANRHIAERFRREALAAGKICHENVVLIADFGQVQGVGYYYAMEYLQGKTLKNCLDDEEAFSATRILHIARQVTSAMERVHALNIIHRDLKPENIFLIFKNGIEDYVKLVDFGIAKIMDEEGVTLTRTGLSVGTPLYMSPEQARGQLRNLDRRTDIYSWGVILFEMLTSRPPFFSDNPHEVVMMQIREIPPSLSNANPHRIYHHQLEDVISRTLSKNPEHRSSSMLELYQELEQILSIPDVIVDLSVDYVRQERDRFSLDDAAALTIPGMELNSDLTSSEINNGIANSDSPLQQNSSDDLLLLHNMQFSDHDTPDWRDVFQTRDPEVSHDSQYPENNQSGSNVSAILHDDHDTISPDLDPPPPQKTATAQTKPEASVATSDTAKQSVPPELESPPTTAGATHHNQMPIPQSALPNVEPTKSLANLESTPNAKIDKLRDLAEQPFENTPTSTASSLREVIAEQQVSPNSSQTDLKSFRNYSKAEIAALLPEQTADTPDNIKHKLVHPLPYPPEAKKERALQTPRPSIGIEAKKEHPAQTPRPSIGIEAKKEHPAQTPRPSIGIEAKKEHPAQISVLPIGVDELDSDMSLISGRFSTDPDALYSPLKRFWLVGGLLLLVTVLVLVGIEIYRRSQPEPDIRFRPPQSTPLPERQGSSAIQVPKAIDQKTTEPKIQTLPDDNNQQNLLDSRFKSKPKPERSSISPMQKEALAVAHSTKQPAPNSAIDKRATVTPPIKEPVIPRPVEKPQAIAVKDLVVRQTPKVPLVRKFILTINSNPPAFCSIRVSQQKWERISSCSLRGMAGTELVIRIAQSGYVPTIRTWAPKQDTSWNVSLRRISQKSRVKKQTADSQSPTEPRPVIKKESKPSHQKSPKKDDIFEQADNPFRVNSVPLKK
jgi:serine/threonine protein kinase